MSDYAIPVPERTTSIRARIWGCVFCFVFDLALIAIVPITFLILPLRLLSETWYGHTSSAFRKLKWEKGGRPGSNSVEALLQDASVIAFYSVDVPGVVTKCTSVLCVVELNDVISFAPTIFVVTTEGDYFDREGVIERNSEGVVTKINIPPQVVLISNHQVYLDWWYHWSFTYWTGGCDSVIIVLKKSLKWVPVIGWGMMMLQFIFLARSWAQDSKYFISRLASLAEAARPLNFFFYPEGTLVSKDTRPLSKKWADKIGVEDLKHTLLPRSTGLHYTLRTLAPRMPELHLLDVTVAYPGIPRNGYGQSYYTLRSVFLNGVPPPMIHIHLQLFHVASEIPIGDVDVYGDSVVIKGRKEDEILPKEATDFSNWLTQLWRSKDQLMENYLSKGTFVPSSTKARSESSFSIPIRLRSNLEIPLAFGLVGPIILIYALKWIYTYVSRVDSAT